MYVCIYTHTFIYNIYIYIYILLQFSNSSINYTTLINICKQTHSAEAGLEANIKTVG